jgi:non-specific serine/threonine protein kinase/serine/threonine-protein kinase
MTDRLPDNSASVDPDLTRAQSSRIKASEAIGSYRLLERVGEGGMGEVWLAEQTQPIHRQVALKVIKAGMDTAQVVARFDAERQALALMDHPAIARVFDAGATRQGRPYFVMEYVRGETITAYATRHTLTVPERIDLFLTACEGVQHAHQKGIIHRDLKPSNVLVTVRDDRAMPKVIDFGVAKATTHALTDRTLHTEIGALIGTPEYMSPEQAEMGSLDIDTRTDVYSLGVMLYELLTGTLPFEWKALREQGLDKVRQTIREVDPPRPSTRVTTAAGSVATVLPSPGDASRLARQLRGDLDWITMKALEKDRTRRYGSVSDLAADLRRHLDDVPVLASPPSATYRVGKFVRRHHAGVAAAGVLILLLVVFAGVMAVQASRIARARDRASQEAATARQVSDFLVGLFRVSDPSEARGTTLTAREILAKGVQQLDSLRDQPAVQARLQATIGSVDTELGLYRDAQPLLETALQTRRRVVGQDHPDTLASANALANLYWYQGQYREAEPLYRDIVERRTRLLGADHPDTLRANYDLASLYAKQKRWEAFDRLSRDTLARQRRVLGDSHPDTLDSLGNLQSSYFARGRYEEALPVTTEVLESERRVFGEDHPKTLTQLHNLATIYDALGRYGEAEPLYLKAVAAKCRVLGGDHPLTVSTLDKLGSMYMKQQRYAEAESAFLAAYLGYAKSVGGEDARTRRVIRSLAEIYLAIGQPTKAAEWQAKLPKEPSPKP